LEVIDDSYFLQNYPIKTISLQIAKMPYIHIIAIDQEPQREHPDIQLGNGSFACA
jgi:hypothetical protein